MRKENPRMDIATRKSYPKQELFRLVLSSGKPTLDETGTLPGRGVYLHKSLESIAIAKKKHLLEKKFSGADCSSLIEELEALL